jgi:hypothetical protein
MKRLTIGALLVSAGAVLLYIGASVLLSPHVFYASNGIALGADPSQLSEVRAPAGLLVVCGVFAGLGAIRRELAQPALVVTAVVYGSYGLSRLVGAAFDGLPSEGLAAAMAIELVVGSLATAALLWSRAADRRA